MTCRQSLTKKMPFRTSFAGLLASAFEVLKGLLASGDITLTVAGSVAGLAISVAKTTYETYREA
jgi:hypothetical protein